MLLNSILKLKCSSTSHVVVQCGPVEESLPAKLVTYWGVLENHSSRSSYFRSLHLPLQRDYFEVWVSMHAFLKLINILLITLTDI